MPVAKLAQRTVEVLESITPAAKTSQRVVEVLRAYAAPSPTTVTGGGVSQRVVEVLIRVSPPVRVGQRVVEVLMTGDGSTGGGGSPAATTHAFGYAV
jgi:hypothetical protein